MNTLIIYISDIHFTGRKAENEGIVINAFIQDIKNNLMRYLIKKYLLLLEGIWFKQLTIRNHMNCFGMM